MLIYRLLNHRQEQESCVLKGQVLVQWLLEATVNVVIR